MSSNDAKPMRSIAHI